MPGFSIYGMKDEGESDNELLTVQALIDLLNEVTEGMRNSSYVRAKDGDEDNRFSIVARCDVTPIFEDAVLYIDIEGSRFTHNI